MSNSGKFKKISSTSFYCIIPPWRYIARYLKSGVWKSIVLVIQHVNFQLSRAHPDRVIWIKLTTDDKYINKKVWLFIHQKMLRRKIIRGHWSSHLYYLENHLITFKENVFMKHGTILRTYNAPMLYFHDAIEENYKLLIRKFNSTWKKGFLNINIRNKAWCKSGTRTHGPGTRDPPQSLKAGP